VTSLPELLGIEFGTVEHGFAEGRLELRQELMAPNDYLHAATVVALADTLCGFGCLASLPEGEVVLASGALDGGTLPRDTTAWLV